MTYDIYNGKACFITGATGGIGKKIALKMAENRCELYLTAKTEHKLKTLKEELVSLYGNHPTVHYKPCDLTIESEIEDVITDAGKKIGDIDFLINCAGIFIVKDLYHSLLSDFDATININVRAPFQFCRAFSRKMKEKRWGRIVNIGSSSAYNGTGETTLYCASKHALLGFSKALHQELKEFNVRTYFVSPAGSKTEMGKKIKNQDFDTFLDPQEIAEYIAFICSFDNELISDEIRLNRMVIQ